MSGGIFITGTDTGVGKTYVACGIASALRDRGVNVGVMKPAETGCRRRSGDLIPGDSMRLMKAAGVKDPVSLVNPYRFRKPLAPLVAAEMERKAIDMRKIQKSFEALSQKHDFIIVEGAGGIMVPLRMEALYLDLAGILGLPVLIVAQPGLGTVNHTLLTAAVLNHRRIPIAGVVINHAIRVKRGPAERTNPAVIETLTGMKVLGIIGHHSADFSQVIFSLGYAEKS